ncbi:hypothetical protein J3B02_001978 [Coemansia erecta]|nr:hypothetical protein J3B02_001978 [Coemansia erecta]
MAGSSVESPSIISGRDPIAYSTSNPLVLFIIQFLIIVCLCRFLHLFLKRLYQPTVISEIIGGIILGPTVLSRWTAFRTHVFPEQSLVNLNLVANFGLVLFLFMVGLELDPRVLKRNIKQCIMISVAGMALPFALGIASSYALYHVLMDGHGKFHIFLLFLGVAMAITAFPVLGRILTELNLLKTVVGSTTISSAAIDDVTSWCLLALVIALTNNTSGLTALWALLVGLGWTLFVFFAVKPAYLWYLRRNGCLKGRDPSQTVLFVTFMMVFISAFFTDIIGIHAIFGGFIVGVIVPHDGGFAIKVTEKIEDVVQIFFLPIYFTLSGLKTNLSSLDDGKTWGLLVLVCVVAFVGKTAGCTVAARLSKFTWRESLTIGILMDCKGLVELIVLNIGLQAGVIDTRVFSMMVVMALTETETDTGDSSNKVLKDSVLNNAQEVSFSQPADHQAALGVRPLFFADGRRVPLVIVPFFGGPDDRQALHLVADLCTHSAVQVLVWRFIKTDLPTDNDIYLDEDRFPAHPAIPQTPAEVHGKGDQPVLKLDLAATRVGDIEEGSKNEADEFYEDNVFISSMLSPCPLNASNARKRDSVASAYAATASSSSAPASPRGLVAEAVAAPPSHQSHHMGSVSVADANADADADVASPVAEPSGTGNGSGGIRQRITQKLRLRSHPSPVAAEEEHENRDNLGDLTASATTTTAGLRGTKFANMTIETIVTTTPLQTMLLRARSLSCSDLIICGRSVRVSMPYFNNEQELAAHTPAGHAHTKIVRQRALGTVAEYLLGFGTDASILVVQTSKNPLGLERFDTNI